MQRTGRIRLWIGSIFLLSACNKATPLPRGANDIQQSVVQAPGTESKSDRPTETGEGLPGYLIDPAKLAIESRNDVWTITGAAAAVRREAGEAASLQVWMIRVSKRTSPFQIKNNGWQVTGTQLAAAQADAQGAFQIQGSLTADDMLFLKLEDTSGSQVQYKAGTLATSVLWIDGTTPRLVEGESAEQIRSQIVAAQPNPNSVELARLVEQVRTTGQCRNCNLAGADLSSLEITACDLSLSNLMGAKFISSNLASCNFSNSNLAQADFTQANLAAANLTQTDITGANFTGANTEGVIGASPPKP